MSPASSAAIAIALQLDPVSSAAALIGCTAQFAGFTAMSFKHNAFGANIAQSFLKPPSCCRAIFIFRYLCANRDIYV